MVIVAAVIAMWDFQGLIAQWLERLTADQQVSGSNAGQPNFSALFNFNINSLNTRNITMIEVLDISQTVRTKRSQTA